MPLSIRPLHPAFAGEVSGVDCCEPLTPDEVAAIEAGMNHYAVLVFRGYTINNFIGDYLWTSFWYLMGFGGLWWLFYYVFYRHLCLLRRGVLTQGWVT